jgi:PAS domain S-box-containing protein
MLLLHCDLIFIHMSEELRLQVVRQFERLNLEYNDELEDMVSFAAKLCKTPIAFITLHDRDVGLLKIKNDLDMPVTPADLSMCCLTVNKRGIVVVNDTLSDVRFCSHPSVTGGMKIRFYAAAQLVTQQNLPVGMLCVMDVKPHALSGQEKLIFKILAKHVVSVMELKLSIDQLDKNVTELKEERKCRLNSEVKLRSMFESLTDAYFLLGLNGELIDFNRAAYDFIHAKYDVKLNYGDFLADILNPNYRPLFNSCIEEALLGYKQQLKRLADYGPKGKIWWDCAFEPVRNINAEIIGVSYITRDITETKINEEKITEQHLLLTRIAEIQSHDYRGPVATILGLMNLIEADNYVASRDYLLMLQQAVNKLDEKIHEVVDIVNIF